MFEKSNISKNTNQYILNSHMFYIFSYCVYFVYSLYLYSFYIYICIYSFVFILLRVTCCFMSSSQNLWQVLWTVLRNSFAAYTHPLFAIKGFCRTAHSSMAAPPREEVAKELRRRMCEYLRKQSVYRYDINIGSIHIYTYIYQI